MPTDKEIRDYFAKYGAQGGAARAKNLTPEQRAKSAKKAANARWARLKKTMKKIDSDMKELKKSTDAAQRRGEAYERRSAARSKKIDKLLKVAKGEK